MHSTHFIEGYMVSVQHILFNYGVRHMVEDNSDYERGNLQPPLHGLI